MTLAEALVVMIGGGGEQIGAPLEVDSRPASRFVAEGDLIPLRLDASKTHLFDAGSGARL